MMVMVGAAAIAIVIVLVIMMRGDGEGDTNESTDQPTPAVSDKTTPRSVAPASFSSAKAGKTPTRPAPALTHETLSRLDEILAEAKTHYNEGVTKRLAGDNSGARAAQAKAKVLLEQWESLIEPQLRWQEEAEMEEWAQPAEYDLLTRKYAPFSRLQNMVRKGGGK